MEAEPPSSDSMEMKQKVDALHALASGPLASATSKLHNRSSVVPSGKDFHFFNNFDEFKNPVKDIKDKSESSLRSVAAADGLWGCRKPPQLPDDDDDDSIEWLININDELIERFSLSMDEFKSLREKEEVDGGKSAVMDLDGGFQMVYGKKKKKEFSPFNVKDEALAGSNNPTAVNVALKDKKTTAPHSRVPFHISSIPRPQAEYNILVNNNNEPFNHVWLEKSSDGLCYIHPLEKHSIMDFVDRNVDHDPVVPVPLESTPFKLVEGVNDLKELAAKLRVANEFAVDLEHNQYRSFQGLTCLMQISTRTEDFIVDTLKLRIRVGPYLREIFKDPLKKKVMHGADRDIIWLQRDFGIYVCNLFDTGQASRVLQLERNSLEYLLHHFCDVNANKEYQNADWRLRPLPDQMIKYAREDTHYLLYIYDLMKRRLLSASSDESDLLLEVYKRSAEICMHLYEKELLTDTSYLHIYGLPYAELNSQQLAIVAGLCQWRDSIARTEDESTGYILPNKTLIEIAKQMPLSSGKLRRLVRHKHPFVERYLSVVIDIIKGSIANSAAFEGIAEMLRKERLETSSSNHMEAVSQGSVPASDIDFPVPSTIAESVDGANHSIGGAVDIPAATNNSGENLISSISSPTKVVEENNFISVTCSETALSTAPTNISGKVGNEGPRSPESLQSRKSAITSVQVLKKPAGAFGALFGNSYSRKTTMLSKEFITDKKKLQKRMKIAELKQICSRPDVVEDYNENKVEQIKSSVALPFHYFSGEEPANSHPVGINHVPRETSHDCHVDAVKMEDVIPLENEGDTTCSPTDSPMEDDKKRHREETEEANCQPKSDEEEISPSSLSSSFEKCFQTINQRRNSQQVRNPSQEPEINFQLKPFDYASARRSMKFGGGGVDVGKSKDDDELKTSPDNRKARRGLVSAQASEERAKGSQPRRRQAFPVSGNRSMSYN